ncbi:MAG: ATP-binding cassette domain-containing protein [Thiohalomonadaceae bacterium]
MSVLRALGLVPVEGMAPLDMDVPEGAVLCLTGPDPALRSTCMQTLAAARYPFAGDVELLGRRLSRLDDRHWLALRREVGFVMREAPLVSSLDALRNVMLPALYHGLANRGASARRAHGWMERLGFTGASGLLPAYLSERDRKILALARALMLSPRLLLVDDPLHGLHVSEARPIATALAQICREAGCALVHATDDLHFMRAHADAILYIAAPAPRWFPSWQAFHRAGDEDVQACLSGFRTEASFD